MFVLDNGVKMNDITKDKLYNVEFRKQLRIRPASVIELVNMDYKVVTNTKDKTYVIVPSEEQHNFMLLGSVNAAGQYNPELLDLFSRLFGSAP